MIKKNGTFKTILLWVNIFAILFILYKLYVTEQDIMSLWLQLGDQSDLYHKLMNWLNPPGETL